MGGLQKPCGMVRLRVETPGKKPHMPNPCPDHKYEEGKHVCLETAITDAACTIANPLQVLDHDSRLTLILPVRRKYPKSTGDARSCHGKRRRLEDQILSRTVLTVLVSMRYTLPCRSTPILVFWMTSRWVAA